MNQNYIYINKAVSFIFVTLIQIEIIKTMKQKQFLKMACLFTFTSHPFQGNLFWSDHTEIEIKSKQWTFIQNS